MTLVLTFFICKMGIIRVLTHVAIVTIKGDDLGKTLSIIADIGMCFVNITCHHHCGQAHDYNVGMLSTPSSQVFGESPSQRC